MEGVIRTRVGYTGGDKVNPTYRSLGNHTEAIQIDYDPDIISYETLLRVFWESHVPTQRAWSTQYKAAIYTNDDGQLKMARFSLQKERAKYRVFYTEILHLEVFYPAEDYHQKYYLRNHRALMSALSDLVRDPEQFQNFKAAARLNGYAGGYISITALKRELDECNLLPDVKNRIFTALEEDHSKAAACKS